MRKQNNVGFTLIELLVVVLIIGILAAVALPQYTKAVEKSRTAEAMQVLGDLATAEQLYYMANNKFTGDLSKLDITMPGVGTTATNTVTTNSYEIKVTTPATAVDATDGTANFTAQAKRLSGTYQNDTLDITVTPAGVVSKTCAVATKGLNKLATTWCPESTTTTN